MKKIFVQFGSGLGSMSRVFPIVKLLKERGHIIRYSGYPEAKKYMNILQIEELDTNFCFNDKKVKNPKSNWKSVEEFWEMMGYNDWEWIEKKVEQLSASIISFAPDLIISDLGFLCWISAKVLRIPLVTITQSCYHPERKYGSFRWWEESSELKDNCQLMKWTNKFLNKNGLDSINTFEEIFTGNLTLLPSYKEIDWLNGKNQYNTHFVGPILFDDEAVWEELVCSKAKYTIFCYTGRFYDNVGRSGENIFINTLEAMKNMDVNLVVSVGGSKEMELAQNLLKQIKHLNFDNLKIVEFLPMKQVYKISDLVIHHGGHGSCLGQIGYEIPSLIIPTHSEREYNARVFQRLGFSEVISAEELSAEILYQKVCKMLADLSYREKLSKFHDTVKQKNNLGVTYAVELIERL